MVELLGHVGITDKYIGAVVKLFHAYRDSTEEADQAWKECNNGWINKGLWLSKCKKARKYQRIIEELDLMSEYSYWRALNK